MFLFPEFYIFYLIRNFFFWLLSILESSYSRVSTVHVHAELNVKVHLYIFRKHEGMFYWLEGLYASGFCDKVCVTVVAQVHRV